MTGMGEKLRQARLARGLSLAAAAEASGMQMRVLAAYESERLDDLPPVFYARSLLRRYADFLGIDSIDLLSLYPEPNAPFPIEPTPHIERPPSNLANWLVAGGVVLLLLSIGAYMYQENRPAPTTAAAILDLPTATPTFTATPLVAVPPPEIPAAPAATATAATQRSPTPAPPPTATPLPAPRLVAVPALAGLTWEAAAERLQAGGFGASRQDEASSQVAPGLVMDQSPRGGESVPAGSPVVVVVSRGAPGLVVPNVVGLPEKEARFLLSQAGLRPAPVANEQGRGDVPDAQRQQVCIGCVLSHRPRAGLSVAPGTEVFLAVRSD